MTRLCIFLLLLTILHQSRVSAMTCRRLPEHFKIRCVNASVSVGNYLQCRCLENCRPFTLKCLESGTFEKMDYFLYCSENQYKTEVEFASGRKVRLSFKNKYFEEQCREGIIRADMVDVCNRDGFKKDNLPLCENQYKTEVEFASGRKVRLSFKNKYFEEQCREGIIRADMVDVCNRDGFKKDNLPLCDHTCNNPPTELECPRNVYRSSEGYIRCLCKQNCLYMRSRCEVGDTLSELASCREAYAIANFYLGDSFDPQETVNATYTPSFLGNSSPEIQCPSGEKTITPGKITCSNGSAKIATTLHDGCDIPYKQRKNIVND
ncbi:hypothetical protein B566_EDAN015124 [Ephemera danica]|nr:hypothetical protein B566_EDAN015124 [Ephemera danica]